MAKQSQLVCQHFVGTFGDEKQGSRDQVEAPRVLRTVN